MPAVAQINVNFANRQEFTELIPPAGVTSVKSISPYTLLQYLLYDRESDLLEERIKSPDRTDFYTYKGGVITAGDKINVKHSDFQITVNTDNPSLPGGNLDIEDSVYVDKIFARRKELQLNYKLPRDSQNRSVIISPRTDTVSNNYFKIETLGTGRYISLYTINSTSKKNSIDIKTSGSNRNIILETDVLSISANDTFNTGNITVNKDATFNKNVTIIGSNTVSQEVFKITNSSGISKFSVDSANGNTDIQGTLNVEGASEIDDTLRVTNTVTFNEALNIDNSITLTNSAKPRKRVIGVRRVDGPQDIFTPTSQYLNDALAIGDFALYAFQAGMIVMWNGSIIKDPATRVLLQPTGGWAICDGETVTWNGSTITVPDLRDRFIVGYGNGNNPNVIGPPLNGGLSRGSTGGANLIQLSVDNLPSHNHLPNGSNASTGQLLGSTFGANDGRHTHQNKAQSNFSGTNSSGTGQNADIQPGDQGPSYRPLKGTPTGQVSTQVEIFESNHSHSVYVTSESRGINEPYENVPPYYALAFIMKL